jgi:hypothetical protein
MTISNVSSVAPVSAVVSADTSPKPVASKPVASKPVTKATKIPHAKILPAKDAAKAEPKKPAHVPAKPDYATATTTIVDAVTASLVGGANIYVAMAKYGEAAGIAGDRKLVTQTLQNIFKYPDVYLPANCPVDTRIAIRNRCDKGKDEAEFSRTVTAVTSGSVLVYYYDLALAEKSKIEGGLRDGKAGLKSVVIGLLSPCAKARTERGKPVDAGWNGAPEIDLAAHLERGTAKDKANNEKTRAARQVGTSVAKTGPLSNVTAGKAVNPAPVAGPLANVQAAAEAAQTDNLPSWESHLNALQASLAGLAAKCPPEAGEKVGAQVAIIGTALATIRKVCGEAATAAAAASPAGKLVKKTGE